MIPTSQDFQADLVLLFHLGGHIEQLLDVLRCLICWGMVLLFGFRGFFDRPGSLCLIYLKVWEVQTKW